MAQRFPKYRVPVGIIVQSCEEVVSARVFISDFGEAFLRDEERKNLDTPILLLPPEAKKPLFEVIFPNKDDVIAEIMGRGEDPVTCEFSVDEMTCLQTLLRSMLAYEPSRRISSNAAVASEWMEVWGKPAM